LLTEGSISVFLDLVHVLYDAVFKGCEEPAKVVEQWQKNPPHYLTKREWISLFSNAGFVYKQEMTAEIESRYNMFNAFYMVFKKKG